MVLKQKAFHGIVWGSIERFSVQGITFLLQLFLARILSPEDYGIMGILSIFIAVAQSFVDSGFANALIQKYDRDEVDYATVFYFNIGVGIIFYLLLFFIAPFVASYFNTPILRDLMRVVSLSVLFNSLSIVPRTKFTVIVDFKTQTKASFFAILFSGVIGILLALSGFGIWSLAIQMAANTAFAMIFLWMYSKWIPQRVFSWNSFSKLFSFGSKMLFAGLISTLYNNLFALFIGKKFTKVDLGNFTFASQYCQFPSENISGILKRTTYPILCNLQNDDKILKIVFLKFLRFSAFLIFPLMVGLFVLAKPMILFLLTDKWSGVILFMQILCWYYLLIPIHSLNEILLQVKGRSDLFLRIEILKKIIGILILIISVRFGIVAMCVGMVGYGGVALLVNTYYTKTLMFVSLKDQLLIVLPILFNSLIMGCLIYGIIFFLEGEYVFQIIVGVFVGGIYYLVSNYFMKSQELKYLLSLVHNKGPK